MNKKKYVILAGLLLPVILLCIVSQFLISRNNTKVVISIDNHVYGTYSLYYDRVIPVKSEDDYNIVQIKDGKVSVTEANCANQICVTTKAISKDNPGTIVCMPHHLIVELK